MTPFERANRSIVKTQKTHGKGGNKELQEVNAFAKQFEQMKQMMKTMNKMPMGIDLGD
jgi:signal recognition particle subunit SRP54